MALIVAALGGIAAAIRWIGGRITAALDRNSAAMIANTASNAVLSTKIDGIATYIQGFPVAEDQAPKRARTPAKGTAIPRSRTHGDEP